MPSSSRASSSDRLVQLVNWVRVLMQVVVTMMLLSASIYLILSASYNADEKKWAYGVVGIAVGFWLQKS